MARTPNKVRSAQNAHAMPVEERRRTMHRLQTNQTSPVRRLSIQTHEMQSPPRQEHPHALARARLVARRRSPLVSSRMRQWQQFINAVHNNAISNEPNQPNQPVDDFIDAPVVLVEPVDAPNSPSSVLDAPIDFVEIA